ncbi:MYXO-CTERM sorting domain-containing protein [Polyangium sp. 15x6]|uniref:MYXO-CTERM sorting domain-containing protein n=1 Tax=Polyangium sp. 15x6 TaxID=3042687 RepID=UPI00249C7654|nr:MYXO-CTERM sorting domain-containing protein [Polyangium sp. 15x6]MDI3287363.1 MYXO-CTERM sorting domain-containing protein [Polyangium sp. 15x6]
MKDERQSFLPRHGRILGLVMIAMLAACSADTTPAEGVSAPASAPAQAARRGSAPMPKDLRAAYIASVQQEASERYAAVSLSPGILRAENHAQRFAATLDGAGISLSPDDGAWKFGMRAAGLGCEGQVTELGAAEPAAEGNRIRYERDELEEWYVNGPLGLEQGFVLRAAPACAGTKVVAIELGGDLQAELVDEDGDGLGEALSLRDSEGRVALGYTDLYVKDAAGKMLPAWLSLDRGRVVIHVDDAGAAYPVEIDPLVAVQQAKLVANDGAASDYLGYSAALSGDTALVGAPDDDDNGTDSGSAYVFVRSNGVWTQQAKLLANDGAVSDNFGFSVALSGETALVGAFRDDDKGGLSGSAYVFVRSNGVWTQQAKLLANDGAVNDEFGYSVALSEEMALVGAFGDDNKGSAYVFVRNGGAWTQQAKLVASDGAVEDYFGHSVALSGDTALVGAYWDDDKGNNAGSAYVFVRSNGVWAQQAKLVANDGAVEDNFGFSVAVSGETALVGAYGDDDKGTESGSAYVFVRSDGAWTQQAKLVANDGQEADLLGVSVAVSGETALVGAYRDDDKGAYSGSAYVFVRSNGVWAQQAKLLANDGALNNEFGRSVALSGATALVGAYGNSEKASYAGAAYVFVLSASQGSSCMADAECAGGFCVDGVCCDTACGGGATGDCQACSVAAGAVVDGTCAPISAGTTCRASAGACDVAETCDGQTQQCPADEFAADGTPCAAGVCEGGACIDGAGGAGGAGGMGGAGGGMGGAGGEAPSDDSGCGCRTASQTGSSPVLPTLALGLLLAWRRRVRRA